MDERGVLEPLARWMADSADPHTRLICRTLRELVDDRIGRTMCRHLRWVSAASGRWGEYRYRVAMRLAQVPGWAAARLECASGDGSATQCETDSIVCGALHGLHGDCYYAPLVPREGAVALLDQLVRVAGRAPTWAGCAHAAGSAGDAAALDWLWARAVGGREIDSVRRSASSAEAFRWLGRHGLTRAPAGSDHQHLGQRLLCSAVDCGNVELVRAFVEETRCIGRHVAWVFDYALAHEEHGGASTLPILQMLVDRFRVRHLRAEVRGRIAAADAAGERRSRTVEWLVERFGLERLPAPTRWRDHWKWLAGRDLRYFTATYRLAIAR
jgi:hypothetical protein